MAADYVPIPFHEWKRTNPDLCQEKLCGECDGGGMLHANEIGEPPYDFEEHPEPMVKCPYCDDGVVSDAGANYLAQIGADRKRWDAARAERESSHPVAATPLASHEQHEGEMEGP